MRQNQTEGRPVVFSEVNAHKGKNKAWEEKDTTTAGTIGGVRFVILCFVLFVKFGYRRPCSKGEHHIILHAMEKKDGYSVIEYIKDDFRYVLVHVGCHWVYKSKKGSSTDYH